MHCFVDDTLPRKEFSKLWPGQEPSTMSQTILRDLRAKGWWDNDTVRVTAHWRMIERDRLLVLFKDGAIIALDEDGDEDDDLASMVEKHGPVVKTRKAPCRYAQMHIVTGFAILSGPYEYRSIVCLLSG
jgi:hypothetical protein